jgi:hypothetical protein
VYSRGGVGARGEGRRGRGGSTSAEASFKSSAPRAPAPEEEEVVARARGSGELLPPNPSARRAQPPSGPVLLGELSKYWGTVLSG